tara:strand:- start:648 stop:1085 length:438 start_codon:yes stop_codon:yes gene_type:complete
MSDLKSLQRLLVVQAIYEISINKERIREETQEILRDIIYNLDLGKKLENSNLNFATRLFDGVVNKIDQIEGILMKSLNNKDKLKTSDNMLLAIFKPAIFEIVYETNTSKKIIISEYLAIADRFLIKKETSLLNGVLDNLKYQSLK